MFFDAPFGLGRESWDDEMLDAKDWGLMINKVKGLARLPDCQFILQHRIDGVPAYKKEMSDAGLKNVCTWFWYKPGQNQANVQVVQAVETLTIGSHVVDAQRFPWEANPDYTNPLNRHNMVEVRSVTKRLRNVQGQVVNQHENPPGLMAAFVDRFGNQGCTILVIGGGAGGDAIGALTQVGATVICLEPDKAQFPHLAARVKLARNGQEKDATFHGQSIVGERGVFAGKKKVAGSQGGFEADDDCDGNDTQQEVKTEDVECLVCSGSATVSTKGVEDFQQCSSPVGSPRLLGDQRWLCRLQY